MIKQFFDRVDLWLEAPQIVLDGGQLLLLIGLIILGIFVLNKTGKKERGDESI